MTTSQILELAKQELLTRGWCQGDYLNTRGEVCTVGALSAAGGGLTWLVMHATDLVGETIGVRHVPSWNDAPGRTPEEVLAAFDAAIALAQRREALPRIGETLWDTAASVPVAVVDAPISPVRGLQESTHPSGGDRATSSSASSSVLVGDSSW